MILPFRVMVVVCAVAWLSSCYQKEWYELPRYQFEDLLEGNTDRVASELIHDCDDHFVAAVVTYRPGGPIPEPYLITICDEVLMVHTERMEWRRELRIWILDDFL